MSVDFNQILFDKTQKQVDCSRKCIPYYDEENDIWVCEFPDRKITREEGCLEYIVSEFIGDGLGFHYYVNGEVDHEHTFEGVLSNIMYSYETFSITGFEEEYSAQEIRVINKLIEKLKEK